MRTALELSLNRESFDRISSCQESLDIESNFSLVFKLKESESHNSTRLEKLYVGDGGGCARGY